MPLSALEVRVGGRDNLIVANSGDGTLALLTGDAGGLGLVRALADQLHPTDLALADLTADQVGVYVASEGRNLAARVDFALDFGLPVPSFGEEGEGRSVALLLPIEESTLAIIATLLPAEGPAPQAGAAAAAEGPPPPAFLIGLDALGAGAGAHLADMVANGPRLAAVVEPVLAEVGRSLRQSFPRVGGLALPVQLLARAGLRVLRSAVTAPGALAAALGGPDLTLPDLPWQQVAEDVGQALLRVGRSVLHLPELPVPAPRPDASPQPAPPEEAEAQIAPKAVALPVPEPAEEERPVTAADHPRSAPPQGTATPAAIVLLGLAAWGTSVPAGRTLPADEGPAGKRRRRPAPDAASEVG